MYDLTTGYSNVAVGSSAMERNNSQDITPQLVMRV